MYNMLPVDKLEIGMRIQLSDGQADSLPNLPRDFTLTPENIAILKQSRFPQFHFVQNSELKETTLASAICADDEKDKGDDPPNKSSAAAGIREIVANTAMLPPRKADLIWRNSADVTRKLFEKPSASRITAVREVAVVLLKLL